MGGVFEPVACFSSNPAGKCISNLVILISSVIACITCSLLLVWHMNAFGWFQKETFKLYTTWIFMMIVIYTAITNIRYMFNVNNGYYLLILLNEMVQSIVIYLVCSMFA